MSSINKIIEKKVTPRPATPELVNFTSDTCILSGKQTAINALYRDYEFTPIIKCITVEQILEQCKPGVQAALELCIAKNVHVKAYITLKVQFLKINLTDGSVDNEDINYMSTRAVPVNAMEDITALINDVQQRLTEKIDNYTRKGSNWIVGELMTLTVKLAKYIL